MLRRIASQFVLASSLTLPVVAQEKLQNGDFESAAESGVPEGWFVPKACAEAGFVARTTDEKPRSGERCGVLEHTEGGEPSIFGNLMRTVDAAPYGGKRVRMRAAVRVAAAALGTHAQLWLRVDGPGEQSALIDNMGDRPIRSVKWAEYEILGDVVPGAKSLAFGLMLFGSGQTYVDDVTLRSWGRPARARSLRERSTTAGARTSSPSRGSSATSATSTRATRLQRRTGTASRSPACAPWRRLGAPPIWRASCSGSSSPSRRPFGCSKRGTSRKRRASWRDPHRSMERSPRERTPGERRSSAGCIPASAASPSVRSTRAGATSSPRRAKRCRKGGARRWTPSKPTSAAGFPAACPWSSGRTVKERCRTRAPMRPRRSRSPTRSSRVPRIGRRDSPP